MEDARFLVHIKTPFLSSVMPYMVSPRFIQKKINFISTGNEDKEGNMPKSQELDPDIRLRQMSTLTSNQITLVPCRYL